MTDQFSQADLVAGGDASERGSADDLLYCYAISAGTPAMLHQLSEVIYSVLVKYIGSNAEHVRELHAKTIWNGDERKRSPFSVLRTKANVIDFLLELSQAIASTKMHVVAAVTLGRKTTPNAYTMKDDHNTPEQRVRKMAIYGALSRLDLNIDILAQKHLGTIKLYMDRESRGIIPRDLVIELAVTSTEPLTFHHRIDPDYASVDSEAHVLIQVADLAAYVVGKYLTLHGYLLHHASLGCPFNEVWKQRAADCNFFLDLWSALNIEAVLVVDNAHQKSHPPWAYSIIQPYAKMLDMGVDICVCSIREAVGRNPSEPPSFSGVGYW